jgi:hypothetical protein
MKKYSGEDGSFVDTAGGAAVGSRLNMPSNTRVGKLNPEDTRLLNKYDASAEGSLARVKRDFNIPGGTENQASKYGMKKGGKVKLFKHHDGIAQRGKTRA